MNSIGSIEYSGMLNQTPDSVKVANQELVQGNQSNLADIEGKLRDEQRETVIETPDSDFNKVSDEGGGTAGGEIFQQKREQQEEEDKKYVELTSEDEDLGTNLDFSA